MVSHGWRRRLALSVAVNDLSIRIVIHGHKSSVAKEAKSGEGIALLFSYVLFLLGAMAKAVLMKAYFEVHAVCYDLSLEGALLLQKASQCAEKPMATRIAALRCTKLFGSLSPEELSDISRRANDLHLQRGEMLFLSGEPAKGLFVVASGEIRVFRQNEDGREQVMHIDRAGAVLGDVPVFDDGPYPASAVSEVETDLLFIEKGDIRDLCVKYPSLALAALKLMAGRVRRHANLIDALSLHEVGQRLALFLLAEARVANFSADVPITFRLRLSNHEIASHIGSVRDVVSRALTRLKQQGLISIDDRDVTILNARGLERYVENSRSSANS